MPKIPQVIRGPAQLGGPARPEDFGSGRGSEAVAQAGKEVAEVNFRLFNEEMESRVSGAVGRAARELNTLQHEVTQIPDHNERTAIYAKKSQKIISGIRKSLTFPKFQGRFGERIEPTLERGRMSIAQGVRQSQIDNSRGERLINIERLQDDFANAANEGDRERIREELNVEFAESLQGGLWSPEAIAKMTIAAENRMEVAGVNRILWEDPEELIEILESEDPESEFYSMSPEKKMEFIGVAVRRIESNFDRDEANAIRIQKEEEKEEKKLADSAMSVMDSLLLKGSFSAEDQKKYHKVLTENREALSPTQRRFYGGRLLAGGGFSGASTNPWVFTQLSKLSRAIRTAAGEEIVAELPVELIKIADETQESGALSAGFREMVDHAYASELITENHRKQLITERDEYAFSDAEAFLDRSFTPLETDDDQAKVIHGIVLMDFSEFKNRFPNASREEAMKYSVGLAQRSSDSATRNVYAAQFNQGLFKMSNDQKTIDQPASAAAIMNSDISKREQQFLLFQLERAVLHSPVNPESQPGPWASNDIYPPARGR